MLCRYTCIGTAALSRLGLKHTAHGGIVVAPLIKRAFHTSSNKASKPDKRLDDFVSDFETELGERLGASFAHPSASVSTSSSATENTIETGHTSSPSTRDVKHAARLWDPFTVNDLPKFEREAYKKHGPGYLDHLTPDEQEKSYESMCSRRAVEKKFRQELGENWKTIVDEVSRQLSEVEATQIRKWRTWQSKPTKNGPERKRRNIKLSEERMNWHRYVRAQMREEIAIQVLKEHGIVSVANLKGLLREHDKTVPRV